MILYRIRPKQLMGVSQWYKRPFSSTKKHEEEQYLDCIRNILEHGEIRKCRNGYTQSIFGYQMRFSLRENTMPLLTTKKVAWKTCLKELLWFLRGETDNTILKNQNVNIWNANATRDFLDKRGLTHYSVDELGPVYGHQWRRFNGDYRPKQYADLGDGGGDGDGDGVEKQLFQNHKSIGYKGVDQIENIIQALKSGDEEKIYSRRLIVSAWNPCQLGMMALPPCHVLFQFYVNSKRELSCSLYQRSGDVGLGIPFNIASYSFLTHLIAKHCGLKKGEFIHTIGDAHIYSEHMKGLKKQITRVPYEFPKLRIKNTHENIDMYTVNDFEIINYRYGEKIKMEMKA